MAASRLGSAVAAATIFVIRHFHVRTNTRPPLPGRQPRSGRRPGGGPTGRCPLGRHGSETCTPWGLIRSAQGKADRRTSHRRRDAAITAYTPTSGSRRRLAVAVGGHDLHTTFPGVATVSRTRRSPPARNERWFAGTFRLNDACGCVSPRADPPWNAPRKRECDRGFAVATPA